MIRKAGMQRFGTALALWALLLNLMLPTAHAQSMARAGADPLLVAFCGQLSPALLKQIELRSPDSDASLKSAMLRSGMTDCGLCAALHSAGPLAAVASPPVVPLVVAVTEAPGLARAGWATLPAALRPQARAPPHFV